MWRSEDNCRSWFYPSVIWVPRIEIRLAGMARAFTPISTLIVILISFLIGKKKITATIGLIFFKILGKHVWNSKNKSNWENEADEAERSLLSIFVKHKQRKIHPNIRSP